MCESRPASRVKQRNTFLLKLASCSSKVYVGRKQVADQSPVLPSVTQPLKCLHLTFSFISGLSYTLFHPLHKCNLDSVTISLLVQRDDSQNVWPAKTIFYITNLHLKPEKNHSKFRQVKKYKYRYFSKLVRFQFDMIFRSLPIYEGINANKLRERDKKKGLFSQSLTTKGGNVKRLRSYFYKICFFWSVPE